MLVRRNVVYNIIGLTKVCMPKWRPQPWPILFLCDKLQVKIQVTVMKERYKPFAFNIITHLPVTGQVINEQEVRPKL